MIPSFHDVHDGCKQLLVLDVDVPLPDFFPLVALLFNVRKLPWRRLIDVALHVDDVVDQVLLILSLDQHSRYVLIVINCVLLFRQHLIFITPITFFLFKFYN